MAKYTSVYSKYELRKMGVKVTGEESYTVADCVGTFEEELDVKVVTKMCRGIEVKSRPRGAGTGTVTMSLHMPYALYCAMFSMDRDDLIEGVQAYGQNNFHKEFAIVGEVYDEDDKKLLIAYPRCIFAVGPNTNIENGAEEVAEVEIEVRLMPDDYGYCRYECMPDDLDETHANVATQWMTAFTPDLVTVTPKV